MGILVEKGLVRVGGNLFLDTEGGWCVVVGYFLEREPPPYIAERSRK